MELEPAALSQAGCSRCSGRGRVKHLVLAQPLREVVSVETKHDGIVSRDCHAHHPGSCDSIDASVVPIDMGKVMGNDGCITALPLHAANDQQRMHDRRLLSVVTLDLETIASYARSICAENMSLSMTTVPVLPLRTPRNSAPRFSPANEGSLAECWTRTTKTSGISPN